MHLCVTWARVWYLLEYAGGCEPCSVSAAEAHRWRWMDAGKEKRSERDVSMHGRSELKKVNTDCSLCIWYCLYSCSLCILLPTSGSKIHAQASDLKCMMQELIQIRTKSNNLLVSIEPCFHTWISSKIWSKIEFIWTPVWFIIAVFLTLAIMSILMMWECSKIQSEKKPSGVKSNSGQD